MKKVMFISPKDNNFYNFRSELILQLVKIGYEVILVCPYGEKINYFTKSGCRFIDVDVDRRGKNVFKDFRLIKKYKNVIKNEKPDIVLTYTSKTSIYAGYVCGKLKVPYIVNNAGLINSKGLFDIFMKILYKIGFRKAKCMIYQNDQEKNVLNKLLRNKIRYRRIPGSGVNLSKFQYTIYPTNDNVIVFNFVARIVSIKGIEEYLKCAEFIKKKYQNTKFYIYGEYDEPKYKERIGALEASGIVEYVGVKMDMKPYITKCHAVIHPSYYEGMTNVILEHSAMGRPCIGSNVPGVMDGIENNKTGFVFAVKNVNSLIDVVEKFINLPHKEKEYMGKLARIKMEKEFDRNIVTKVYLEEIEKIIGA